MSVLFKYVEKYSLVVPLKAILPDPGVTWARSTFYKTFVGKFADVTLADDDTNLIYELITSIHEAAG